VTSEVPSRLSCESELGLPFALASHFAPAALMQALEHRARPRRVPLRPQYSAGTLPHEAMLRSIELYGREVMPRVRALLDAASPTAPQVKTAASNT
jgi:hypothetical protein